MKASQAFFMGGIILATMAAMCNILAFGLPSWIYTYEDNSEQGISYAGLWTFCLEAFFDFSQRTRGKPCDNSASFRCLNANGGVPMYGCHWIYSDDLEEIRWTILNPAWYIAVQIMATVNLMMALISVFGLFFVCLVRKNKCPLIFGIISQFLCTALGLCETVLYAARVTDDEYYTVPNVGAKSLGAGWGMAVVAFIIAGFAMAALLISFVLDDERKAARALKKADKAHDESAFLPPKPATRQYNY